MHDLVHDLAQFVVGEVYCVSLSERIRHLSDNTKKSINRIQLHPIASN